MVCSRCIMAVRDILEKTGLQPLAIKLGEADIKEQPSRGVMKLLNTSLKMIGFELTDNRERRITEQIKNLIVIFIHHGGEMPDVNLSAFIAQKLHYDYNYLGNIFSETEGISIEQYLISQKIEKIKELLMYDELSLTRIAEQMGDSSVSYLSGQFKKQTGLTPAFYKSLKEKKRRNIEDL